MFEGKIVREEIDVDKVVKNIIANTYSEGAGALVVFIGYVKGVVEGHTVNELDYQAYEPYATKKLQEIVSEEKEEGVLSIVVYHRVGDLKPGEPTIYVFVSALDRKKAFEKARRILERVKHEVPIFKLEKRNDGEYWVLGDRNRVRREKKEKE